MFETLALFFHRDIAPSKLLHIDVLMDVFGDPGGDASIGEA
jgi:hypothetical protein